MVEDALLEAAERETDRDIEMTFNRISEDPFLTARLLVVMRTLVRET